MATTALFTLNPLPEIRERFLELVEQDLAITRDLESLRDLPCETLDGYRLPLWVNTGFMADVTRSLDQGAEGVGLYRTESAVSVARAVPQ